MGVIASLETDPPHANRTGPRARVNLRSDLRKRGMHHAKVELLDLSCKGFSAETALSRAPGMEVWVRIPGVESKTARVIWVDGSYAGCEFHTPFHESVFERLVAQNAR